MDLNYYKEVKASHVNETKAEILIAYLSEIGFDGFEQEEQTLKAYIDSREFDQDALAEIENTTGVKFTLSDIKEQNWNALWESNFAPLQIDDFVGIRAEFHPSFGSSVQHEIRITPKMSFGTGHHATTYMMISIMKHLPIDGASVFDFGTGTGILAILAEKLGAQKVIAIDNDKWSIENATENIQMNNCRHIQLQLADHPAPDEKFDIVLANINKNIILQNIDPIDKLLHNSSHLVLSGLLAEDENEIIEIASRKNWKYQDTQHRKQWIAIHFIK